MSIVDYLSGVSAAAKTLAVVTVQLGDDSILAAEHVLHRVEQIRADRRFVRELTDLPDAAAQVALAECLRGERRVGDTASPPHRVEAVDCSDPAVYEHVAHDGE